MMTGNRSLSLPQVFAVALVVLASCAGPGSERFDRQELEVVEDLTESLANDLLAFSVDVRDRNFEAVEGYVAERIEATPWPAAPIETAQATDWIRRHEWAIPTEAAGQERGDFLLSLRTFIGRFGEIEDARFKVKSAHFDETSGDHGDAHLKFFIVGRNTGGNREWIKGTAHADMTREGEGPWRFAAFRLESLQSKVSDLDLFSEIALPAGLSVVFPPFGVGKNQGFVAHGAAAADVNGDGLVDLAATGLDQNYLYINSGDGRFQDRSAESLVKFAPPGSGPLFVDFDNDGDPDLFLASVGRQVLLENRFIPDNTLEFRDVSDRAGVDREAVGFSAISADVNRDGYADVYVCSYNRYGDVMPNSWAQATNGTPNLLLVNQGDGTFEEVGAEWGVDDGRWSYAAGFVDIDEDGDQDLYVANDFGENALFRNDGERFVDVADALGIKDPGFGMGVSFGDYDNDGDLDLHVTNMSSTAGNRILKLLYPEEHAIRKTLSKEAAGNSLYENAGDGTFRDVTQKIGGLSGGWGFGGGFLDFDNNGWEDLYTPNGFVSGKFMKDT
jgi:hypothetical protein